ncbi:MAG: hypothetical protein EHM46_06420, partial [Bacteroidetes bacterium]
MNLKTPKMRTLSILLILSLCRFLPAQEERADALVSPRKARQVITVGGPAADIQGFNNRSVQYAIDALEETGGTVVLQPGSYEIVSPVRLRSNVELKGSGATTILKRADGVQTRFTADADFGELKLTVEDPSGFGIGMKVQVTDSDNNSCWNVSAATITDIVDHVLYIDKGLIRDYQSDRNGLVSNASSVIEITDAENVTVS